MMTIIITSPGTYTCEAFTYSASGANQWTETITVTSPHPPTGTTPTNYTSDEVATPSNTISEATTPTNTQITPPNPSLFPSSQNVIASSNGVHVSSTSSTVNIIMATPTASTTSKTKSVSSSPIQSVTLPPGIITHVVM